MRMTFLEVALGRKAAIAGSIIVALSAFPTATYASNLDTIGVTLLRATTTNLDGSGTRVGQVEALLASPAGAWEVNPSNTSVLVPTSRFTWYSTNSSASTYPNTLGVESSHADGVAWMFYGLPAGVSTNVQHIGNFEADYFFFMAVPAMTAFTDHIINQSFVAPQAYQSFSDTNYDNYAVQNNVLFVNAVGDGGAVQPPSTSYNGIGVGAYGGATSVGPTPDNGRAKPDITAPSNVTSYSAPQVAGAAAILLQAALRGDGGADTNSAADNRTVKALLLNGAVKPLDWANPAPSPLDPNYGTGVVNVFNSWKQLAGGKHPYIASNSVPTNNPHLPISSTNYVSTRKGWDLDTISSSILDDGVNHYCFNLTNMMSGATYTADITLVWNRQFHALNINDLDLFLYDMDSGALIACSTSRVDNVEHIYVRQLPPGRYDLQVLKHGGATVSFSETYALAFEFFGMPLNISFANGNAVLNWPIYPAGFSLESCTAGSTNWTPVSATPVITNNQNQVIVSISGSSQVFRLLRKP